MALRGQAADRIRQPRRTRTEQVVQQRTGRPQGDARGRSLSRTAAAAGHRVADCSFPSARARRKTATPPSESSASWTWPAGLPSSIPGRAGRRNSGPPNAMRPWPLIWASVWHLPTLVVWAGPAERTMAEQIAACGADGSHRPADHAPRVGRAGPACEVVPRLRHWPAASGGGGGNAVCGPVRSLAGGAARALRCAEHRAAEDVLRGLGPRSAAPRRRSTWRASRRRWSARRATEL